MRIGRAAGVAMVLGLSALVASCGEPSDGVTVLAASSLTDAFTEMGAAFEASTGIEVAVGFAGSSTVVAQVREGAPADVVALADASSMERVVPDGGEPFATNRLVLVVPRGNPGAIAGLADLSDADVVALAASQVPAGRYAEALFAQADLPVPASSEEDSVRAVLRRVAVGDAHAGLVYATDARSAGDRVAVVDLPPGLAVVARYAISVTADGRRSAAARRFVDYVLGDEGQEILRDHGFGPA